MPLAEAAVLASFSRSSFHDGAASRAWGFRICAFKAAASYFLDIVA